MISASPCCTARSGAARVVNSSGQPTGDLQPLLDRHRQQYPGVRGHPAAVEPDMHRLARHRWQTRQNLRTSPMPLQPNHTRIQFVMLLPASPLMKPDKFFRLGNT
jgi:hypothetical protein